MRVSDIMTSAVDVVTPSTTVRDAARIMQADNVGALPVGEHDRLVGMVTDRDIAVRAVAEDQAVGDTAVREVMSEGVAYCYEDDGIEEAARVMGRHQVRRLPVIDRGKRLVGMVALADLARAGVEPVKQALEGVSEPTDAPRRYRKV